MSAPSSATLRIVYDGAPFAGKTTSLRALAEMLGAEVTTPAEREGRTLYFDWVDYTGGLFRGEPIHCELVGVPGQDALRARRQAIVESADAIVFVADTRPEPLEEALARLRELVPWCREQRPPVGILFQANYRDVPSAVPIDTLRERLAAIAPIALAETSATTGSGVRPAFVRAVGLALSRLQDRETEGEANAATREKAQALLARLRSLEETLDGEGGASDAGDTGGAGEGSGALFSSERHDPSPLVWPPVDGRVWLYEVAELGLVPKGEPGGAREASSARWLCRSPADARYDALEGGRRAMVELARRHGQHRELLSTPRALVLTPAEDAAYRIWHLLQRGPSLATQLSQAAARGSAPALARELVAAFEALRAIRAQAAGLGLPLSFETVGIDARGTPRLLAPLGAEMPAENPADP
ncbi:MAG TPA: GTPase domain-containing protein, partial [Polyangiaceae bacterium LLY-WYZ-15_(1-7)]|nr:GTPase domain-containing protein [Polyangiaceae bacterium LLY-WYZ-15_(1-7)]